MRIAIIGATGGTGLQVTKQALERDHDVSVLVRTPSKLGLLTKNNSLHVHEGDILTADEPLRAALEGADAVVVSLGGSSLGTQSIRAEGTQRVLEAMATAGGDRIVVRSSLGAGDSKT